MISVFFKLLISSAFAFQCPGLGEKRDPSTCYFELITQETNNIIKLQKECNLQKNSYDCLLEKFKTYKSIGASDLTIAVAALVSVAQKSTPKPDAKLWKAEVLDLVERADFNKFILHEFKAENKSDKTDIAALIQVEKEVFDQFKQNVYKKNPKKPNPK